MLALGDFFYKTFAFTTIFSIMGGGKHHPARMENNVSIEEIKKLFQDELAQATERITSTLSKKIEDSINKLQIEIDEVRELATNAIEATKKQEQDITLQQQQQTELQALAAKLSAKLADREDGSIMHRKEH